MAETATAAPTTTTAAATAARPARAQVLADMPWDPSQQIDTPKAVEKKDDEKPVEAAPAAVEAAVEAKPAEDADDLDENARPKAETKTDDDPAPDADTAKRLSVLQKAEKRQRDQIAAARADAKAELDAERARILPIVDQVKQFQAVAGRAKESPGAVMDLLRNLGVPASQFAAISRLAWFASPEGMADPKSKAQAEETQLKYEQSSQLSQALAKIEELQGKFESTAKQAESERNVNRYVDKIKKADPEIRQLLDDDPDEMQTLIKIAVDLDPDADEPPDADDVIVAFKKHRQAEAAKLAAKLKALGYDVAPGKAKIAAAAAVESAKPAKTLDPSAVSGTPVPVAKKLSAEEQRKKLLAEMPWDTATS